MLQAAVSRSTGQQAAQGPHQKKEDCTMPMVAVSQPYCFAIGRMAMLMLTRSMLHSMKATKHSPMIVHLRFHRLPVGLTCSGGLPARLGCRGRKSPCDDGCFGSRTASGNQVHTLTTLCLLHWCPDSQCPADAHDGCVLHCVRRHLLLAATR